MDDSILKTCTKCGEVKPILEYSFAGKGRRRAHCKACQKVQNDKRPLKRPVRHIPEGHAWCSRCMQVKPSVYFYVAITNRRGLSTYCKACFTLVRAIRYAECRADENERSREWKKVNPEAARVISARCAKKNKTKLYQMNKIWKTKNIEKVRSMDASYQQRNAQALREKAKLKYQADPAIARERELKYKARYPDRLRLRWANANAVRRARIRRARIGKVSYRAILKRDAGVCHICGLSIEEAKYHFDHVIPLVKGGAHSMENIRLSHATCNLKKGATCAPE